MPIEFNVSVKLDINEFAMWNAAQIEAFFAGIALVLAKTSAPTGKGTEIVPAAPTVQAGEAET